MEDRIKAYYRDKRSLAYNEHRLNMLNRHRDEAQRDIDTDNIRLLRADLQGISYDKDKVQTSGSASPQEKALDNAFARLEQKIKALDIEILDTKQLIREFEQKTSDMEFIIGQLSNEARRLIEMRYKENRSGRAIEIELNLSESSVWRFHQDILEDMTKWISYNS